MCAYQQYAGTAVKLDGATIRNLELLENSEGGTAGTLLAALDTTASPAGKRMLRQVRLRRYRSSLPVTWDTAGSGAR